jgi:nicotinamidase-related amidase
MSPRSGPSTAQAAAEDSGRWSDPLILVDMINTYDHEHGERCAERAATVLPRMLDLLAAARCSGLPVIYVNDRYGAPSADRETVVETVLATCRYPELVAPLLPRAGERFVAKGRHSIFYGTDLEQVLTSELNAAGIVLAGQATEQCVLYSALDAYVREFAVSVVTDCTIAIDDQLASAAIEMMRRNMHSALVESSSLRVPR